MRHRTPARVATALALAAAGATLFTFGCSGNTNIVTDLAGGTQLNALMDSAQVVPPPPAPQPGVAGSLTIILNQPRNGATINLGATNLSTAISAAHIHRGARGQIGPIVKTLTTSGNLGSGNWSQQENPEPMSPDIVNDMLAGNLYVDIHTASNPDGELRGQIVARP